MDLYVYYLLRVHQYDYYWGHEGNSPEDMSRKTYLYLRSPNAKDSSTNWLTRLDDRVQSRIENILDNEDKLLQKGGRSLEKVLDSFLSSYVKKESDTKYRCVECQKLFKGDDYVKKHLKSKHAELTKTITQDTLLFNAFITDPNKIDPTRFSSANDNFTRGQNRQDRYRDGNRPYQKRFAETKASFKPTG